MKIVLGIFDPDGVHAAVQGLEAHGFDTDKLTLISTASAIPTFLDDDLEGKPELAAGTGAAVGAVAGGSLGALGAWVAASIPGVELSLLATGLMNTAVGSVIGGYLGSLYSVRAENQTKMAVHDELEAGKILLLVRVSEKEKDSAASLLTQSGGQHVEIHPMPTPEGG